MQDSTLPAWCLRLRACVDSTWEFIRHLGVTAKLISYLLTYSDLCCYKVEFIFDNFFFL